MEQGAEADAAGLAPDGAENAGPTAADGQATADADATADATAASCAARGVVTSKFHFVDLAGSERCKKTQAAGDRMKEVPVCAPASQRANALIIRRTCCG